VKNLKSPHSINVLIRVLSRCQEFFKEFSREELKKAGEGKVLDELQKTANEFLIRTQLNVSGLLPLLESYKSKGSMILPIGLIMRSIFSDFITLCYLITFSDNERSSNESIKNELIVLNRDFIKSIFEIKKMEGLLAGYLPNFTAQFFSKQEAEDYIRNAKLMMPNLFDAKGATRKISSIRSTSNSEFFKKFGTKIDSPESFMTDKYKWDRIEHHPSFKKYILIFLGYKIFSQFQHYSPISMQLLDEKHEAKLFYELAIGVDAINIITDIHFQLIDNVDNKHLSDLRLLKVEIDNIFGSSTTISE